MIDFMDWTSDLSNPIIRAYGPDAFDPWWVDAPTPAYPGLEAARADLIPTHIEVPF